MNADLRITLLLYNGFQSYNTQKNGNTGKSDE